MWSKFSRFRSFALWKLRIVATHGKWIQDEFITILQLKYFEVKLLSSVMVKRLTVTKITTQQDWVRDSADAIFQNLHYLTLNAKLKI